jgi:hypothetical protein
MKAYKGPVNENNKENKERKWDKERERERQRDRQVDGQIGISEKRIWFKSKIEGR